MVGLLTGYARCSTDQQDLTARRDGSPPSASTPTGSTSNTASPAPTANDPGGSVYDPNDAVGRLLFNVLAMVAEFSVISTRRAARVPEVGAAA